MDSARLTVILMDMNAKLQGVEKAAQPNPLGMEATVDKAGMSQLAVSMRMWIRELGTLVPQVDLKLMEGMAEAKIDG